MGKVMIKIDVPLWQADILDAITRSGSATASELISYCIESQADLSLIEPVMNCGSPKRAIKLYLPTIVKRRLEKQVHKNKKKGIHGGAGIAALVRGIIRDGLTDEKRGRA